MIAGDHQGNETCLALLFLTASEIIQPGSGFKSRRLNNQQLQNLLIRVRFEGSRTTQLLPPIKRIQMCHDVK